jgi:isoamylase/glycogen operon protein
MSQGVNFSLYSKHAHSVVLHLFRIGETTPAYQIPLDPKVNRTGRVWHIFLEGLSPTQFSYSYRIEGPNTVQHRYCPEAYLLDPYAKGVVSSKVWGIPLKQGERAISHSFPTQGLIFPPSEFDWEGDALLKIPLKDLVIYEMHVRGFTQDPSSRVKHRGTFLGIIEKIPYLKQLGINAIELLPIHEFNECEYRRDDPKTGQPLCNYWGYSTVNFFSPMRRYGVSSNCHQIREEFKMMVKELHKNGIEVILDVVFNHTAEGNEHGPIFSFKGIDNSIYYLLTSEGYYYNYSGCGNTVQGNHPMVEKLIRDALRYWVSEMHVDGFRFDLASILTRGKDGVPLMNPRILESISEDPLLSEVKLIAEAWDAGGLYQVGEFAAEGGWAEWNGKYRDCIRRFIKGNSHCAGEFATRICGSRDLYGRGRHPYHSINFITAHDGFSLYDLVSYNHKYNQANGEENRDGCNENDSWNCGVDGNTDDPNILALRKRQMRNLHLALIVSQGVPMIHMGDEYGHSKEGNNNTWCHDNALNWHQWHLAEKESQGLLRFYQLLNHFRRDTPILRQSQFLTDNQIDWHGTSPFQADWSEQSRLVAFTLYDEEKGQDLYILFNANWKEAMVELPKPRTANKSWHIKVDTSRDAPYDIYEDRTTPKAIRSQLKIPPYSSLLLILK